MDDRKIIFSKFLKEARKKKNISQEKLSELTYINVRTISDMENGKVDFDLNKLESISSVLNIDLISEFFSIFYEDSKAINSMIESLNNEDRILGSYQAKEINYLIKLKNSTNRQVIKLKADKLILLLESIQVKDDKNLRKKFIVEALNKNGYFNFENLSLNYYDDIDFRILMNYALSLNDPYEKLKIYKFIEKSNPKNKSINPILYHNMANIYYILRADYKALEYINKAIDLYSKTLPSPVMLYTKGIILKGLSLPYENYVRKSLELSKFSNDFAYNCIMKKIKGL